VLIQDRLLAVQPVVVTLILLVVPQELPHQVLAVMAVMLQVVVEKVALGVMALLLGLLVLLQVVAVVVAMTAIQVALVDQGE